MLEYTEKQKETVYLDLEETSSMNDWPDEKNFEAEILYLESECSSEVTHSFPSDSFEKYLVNTYVELPDNM